MDGGTKLIICVVGKELAVLRERAWKGFTHQSQRHIIYLARKIKLDYTKIGRENNILKNVRVSKLLTFPVLAISLIPNLLRFLWKATIFPGSPVTYTIQIALK